MKSAFIIQRPDKIFIHTDTPDLTGKHWQQLLDIPSFKDVLVIKKVEAPSQVFGVDLFWNHHKADVLRYEIFLKKFHSFIKIIIFLAPTGAQEVKMSVCVTLCIQAFLKG